MHEPFSHEDMQAAWARAALQDPDIAEAKRRWELCRLAAVAMGWLPAYQTMGGYWLVYLDHNKVTHAWDPLVHYHDQMLMRDHLKINMRFLPNTNEWQASISGEDGIESCRWHASMAALEVAAELGRRAEQRKPAP
jgi:hypothetical protein